MADYDVVANTAGVHIAGLARGNAVLGVGVPGLLSVIIIILILIGLLLTGIAVWMLRTTEPESVTLGPLSVMGRKRWRTADPDTQRRELEAARPLGAEGAAASVTGRSEPDDRAGPDDRDPDGQRDGDHDDDDATRAHDAVARASSKRDKKRTPKRYLAGDEPRDGDAGRGRRRNSDTDDDDTRAELGRLADSGPADFDDDDFEAARSRESALWGAEAMSASSEADMVALTNGSVDERNDDWAHADEQVDEQDDERGRRQRSSRAVFRARRRQSADDRGVDNDGPDTDYDVDVYEEYVEVDDDYPDDYVGDDDVADDVDAEYLDDDYADDDYDDDYVDDDDVDDDADYADDGGYRRRNTDDYVDGYDEDPSDEYDDYEPAVDGAAARHRFDLGEYDPYDEAMGLTPQPRPSRSTRRITAASRRRDTRPDIHQDMDSSPGGADRSAAENRANADTYLAETTVAETYGDDNIDDYDETDHEHEDTDMEYQNDNFADNPGSATDPFFDDDFDGSWDEARSTGRQKSDGARRPAVDAGKRAGDVDEAAGQGRGRRSAGATAARRPDRSPSAGMTSFDPDALVDRFRERAAAVRRRPLPPVAGEERQEFIRQAKIDYQDFAMIGDAEVTIEDGVLVMRVDLRGDR